ncbi:MAG: ADP-ribosylation factor-directed GTPase activating protein isoform b, partial [Planctomycetes bacterium]|nr:ADP-ribosylation factor-directed GTPase activating protein isoform b [Planctomycetota bacterium]
YFQRGGRDADLAQDLGVSGHVLEFVVLATSDQQLAEPWVKRAVMHLCELFRKTRSVPLECGALYHAAHGLALYRDRVFGPRP